MTTTASRHRSPLGSVVFSLGLAAVFGYYAQEVHASARGVTDWLLIVPAAGIGITALLTIVGTKVIDWYRQEADAPDAKEEPSALPAVLFMVMLALYVALIPVIGFDLGSLLFLCLTLYLQGERRWWAIIGFGVVVSTTIVLMFVKLLNINLPTLLL